MPKSHTSASCNNKEMADKESIGIKKNQNDKLDLQSKQICVNVYKTLLQRDKPPKDILDLVSSLTGISEPEIAKILVEFGITYNKEKKNKTKTFNVLADTQIIKTLIEIEKFEKLLDNLMSIYSYQEKFNKLLCCNFSIDEIKKWLKIIGIRTIEDEGQMQANNAESTTKLNFENSTIKLGCKEEFIEIDSDSDKEQSTLPFGIGVFQGNKEIETNHSLIKEENLIEMEHITGAETCKCTDPLSESGLKLEIEEQQLENIKLEKINEIVKIETIAEEKSFQDTEELLEKGDLIVKKATVEVTEETSNGTEEQEVRPEIIDPLTVEEEEEEKKVKAVRPEIMDLMTTEEPEIKEVKKEITDPLTIEEELSTGNKKAIEETHNGIEEQEAKEVRPEIMDLLTKEEQEVKEVQPEIIDPLTIEEELSKLTVNNKVIEETHNGLEEQEVKDVRPEIIDLMTKVLEDTHNGTEEQEEIVPPEMIDPLSESIGNNEVIEETHNGTEEQEVRPKIIEPLTITELSKSTANNKLRLVRKHFLKKDPNSWPPLDYFTKSLEEVHVRYSKISVAQCLNNLKIKYRANEQLVPLYFRPINDPKIGVLLKLFNKQFYKIELSRKEQLLEEDCKRRKRILNEKKRGEEARRKGDIKEIDSTLEQVIEEILIHSFMTGKIVTVENIMKQLKEKNVNNANKISIENWLKQKPFLEKYHIVKMLSEINNQVRHNKIASLEYFEAELRSNGIYDFPKDKIKKVLDSIGINYAKRSAPESEIALQKNLESNRKKRKNELKMKETSEELIHKETEIPLQIKEPDKETRKEDEGHVEIQSKSDINIEEIETEEHHLSSTRSKCNDIEESLEPHIIKPQRPADIENQIILEIHKTDNTNHIKIEEFNVKLEEDTEKLDKIETYSDFKFKEEIDIEEHELSSTINKISKFIDIEESLEPHIINLDLNPRRNEDILIQEFTNAELDKDTIKVDEIEEIYSQDFKFKEEIKIEEQGSSSTLKKMSEESLESHLNCDHNKIEELEKGTRKEEDIKVQLKTEEIEIQEHDMRGMEEFLEPQINNLGKLPPLDYFVDSFEMRSLNVPKSYVTYSLKKLNLSFIDNEDTETKSVENDSMFYDEPNISHLLMKLYYRFVFPNPSEEQPLDEESNKIIIDPKIEELITDTAINEQRKGNVPTLHFLLGKVRKYDGNIDKNTLEIWLRKLNISFKGHSLKHKKPKNPNKQKIRKIITQQKYPIPNFDYFYKEFNKKRSRCSSGTLKKWLEYLGINFKWNKDNNLRHDAHIRTEEELCSSLIKELIDLEYQFYREQEGGTNAPPSTPARTAELPNARTAELPNTYTAGNFVEKSDLLQYFFEILNDPSSDSHKDVTYAKKYCLGPKNLKLSSTVEQICINLDNYEKQPTKILESTLLRKIKFLSTQLKNNGERSILNFIYHSKMILSGNPKDLREPIKIWLTVLKMNFQHEIDYEKKIMMKRPTLAYFHNKLKVANCACSKNTVKHWLETLEIRFYVDDGFSQESPSDVPLTPAIAKFLIRYYDEFRKDKKPYYTHFQVLKDFDYLFKIKNQTPTLDFIHHYMQLKFKKTYSKETIKYWLILLEINFKENEPHTGPIRDMLPPLDYFHERLQNAENECSKQVVKNWLDFLDIKFDDTGCDSLGTETEPQLTQHIVKLLNQFDNEFHVLKTKKFTYFNSLKELKYQLECTRFVPTLDFVYEYIVPLKIQESQIHYKEALKQWLNLFKIIYLDDPEETKINPDFFPSLDYFYGKMTEASIICSKASLKQCLDSLKIIYDPTNCLINLKCQKPALETSPRVTKLLKTYEENFKRLNFTFSQQFRILRALDSEYGSKCEVPFVDTICKDFKQRAEDLKWVFSKKKLKGEWLDLLKISFRDEETVHGILPSLNYFFEELEKRGHICGTLNVQSWLEHLDIKFDTSNCEINSSLEVQLTTPIVKILKQLNNEVNAIVVGNATHLRKLKELDSEFRGQSETPDSSDIYQFLTSEATTHLPIANKIFKKWLKILNVNYKDETSEVLPTLDFFFKHLRLENVECTKGMVKKWLENMEIKFDLNGYVQDPNECRDLNGIPRFKLWNILNKTNDLFHEFKPVLPCSYYKILTELDRDFQAQFKTPSLDFIHQHLTSSKLNPLWHKEHLKRWLVALKIDFTEIFFEHSDDSHSFYFETDSLPTLDYFFERIKSKNYQVCCKALLKRWLESKAINLEPLEENLQKCEEPEVTIPAGVMKQLTLDEQEFFENKKLFLTLVKLLRRLEREFQIRATTPTLTFIHQSVLSARLFPNDDQIYSKGYLKWLLTKLNIKYKFKEYENLPSLEYFQDSLLERNICVTTNQIKAYLRKLKINFKDDFLPLRDTQINKIESNILIPCIKDAHHEFHLKRLIRLLKETEKNYNQGGKPLTFTVIYEVIEKNFNPFRSKLNNEYKKIVFKKWVKKLGIKFTDDDLRKEVAPLEYFYKKLTSLKGNICSRETLQNWLIQTSVDFKENENLECPVYETLDPDLVSTIRKIFQFSKLWDVEKEMKRIEDGFVALSTVPSLEYLRTKLYEIKGRDCVSIKMKDWLDFLGIPFKNIRDKQDRIIELKVEESLKQKSKSATFDMANTSSNVEEYKYILEYVTEMSLENYLNKYTKAAIKLEKRNKEKNRVDTVEEPTETKNKEETKQDELTPQIEFIKVEDDDVEGTKTSDNTDIIEIDDDEPKAKKPKKQNPEKQNSKRKPKSLKRYLDKQEESSTSDPLELREFQTNSSDNQLNTLKHFRKRKQSSITSESPNTSSESQTSTSKETSPEHQSKEKRKQDLNTLQYAKLSDSIAPPEVMKGFTDVEYDFYVLKRVPTLNHFYSRTVEEFGNEYPKELVEHWLKKSGIRFKRWQD